MRDKLWLLTVAGKAALITTGGIFALTFALTGSKNLATRGADEIFLIMALIPVVIAAWWMFRKLQLRCTRREAAAVATLVAVLTPCRWEQGCCLVSFRAALQNTFSDFCSLWLVRSSASS
jgi:hypothetical protein